jgi:hypothetical protein
MKKLTLFYFFNTEFITTPSTIMEFTKEYLKKKFHHKSFYLNNN